MVEDRGGEFIGEEAAAIFPGERSLLLKSGRRLSYDVVSFNTGSEVSRERLPAGERENIFPVKPVIRLLAARRFLMKRPSSSRPPNLLVAGGGPAGVELAANLIPLLEEIGGGGTVALVGGSAVLGGYPPRAGDLARKFFRARGVEVLEGAHIAELGENEALLRDGRRRAFDAAFLAVGIRPAPLFREAGLPVAEGGELLVDSFLRSPAYAEIFGGGDCIALREARLAKVGVYAVRQNPVLFHNLLAALEGGPLRPFVPQRNYLAILNMGYGRGILWRRNWVFEGRSAFLLKNYIDRSFMKKFQVSGELEEQE
jgi:NADH dehydrogenase FAD-containing subunit